MSDRTWEFTEFRIEYYPLVAAALASKPHILNLLRDGYDDEIVRVEDGGGANYGNMDWLTSVLLKLHIPYDHMWGNGADFRAGMNYVRPDEDGELTHNEQYEGNERLIDAQHVLDMMAAIKGSHPESAFYPKMVAFLEDHIKETTPPIGLLKVPLRPFTEEEKAIAMAFKFKQEE